LYSIAKVKAVSLRVYMLIGLVLASWLPLGVFAYWAYSTVAEREVAAVREQHVTLARQLTLSLDRYARDVESTFRIVGQQMTIALAQDAEGPVLRQFGYAPLRELLWNVGFRRLCIIDRDVTVVADRCLSSRDVTAVMPMASYAVTTELLDKAENDASMVAWTGVAAGTDGMPALFLVQAIGHERYVLGELGTGYIIEAQNRIQFRKTGHAAVVDRSGRLLAHPKPEWVAERKDISVLKPIKAMMAGESGTIEFFSPATKQDMMAAYTVVPSTGWGVMVPQVAAEVQEGAQGVLSVGIILGLATMAATGALIWWASRRIEAGVQPIIQAAQRISKGNLSARISTLPGFIPAEQRHIARAFNRMATRLERAITRQVMMHEEAQQAEAHDRAKSELMAHVSHEFRTPLNAIIGFSEVMSREMFGAIENRRYIEYATTIRQSGEHLLDLVNDVLEISRSDLEKKPLELEWIDLAALTREAVALVSAAHERNSHVRHLAVAPNLPRVHVDERLFRQILINLLDNAEKYTPDGGRVDVDLALTVEGTVTISVADNGIGMSPEGLESAMVPFGRGTDPMVRQRVGTGLGLSVVGSIIERHGAEMRFDSAKGEGTTVTVTVPASMVDNGQVRAAAD